MDKKEYIKKAEEILNEIMIAKVWMLANPKNKKMAKEYREAVDALYQLHLEGVRENREDAFIVNKHKTDNGFTYQWQYKNTKKGINLAGTSGAEHSLLEAIKAGYEYLLEQRQSLEEKHG